MTLPLSLAQIGETTEPALTRDVSSGGVYFELQEPPQPGSQLEFILTLPVEITLTGPVQIRCVGKVIRVDRGVGRQVGVAATIDRYEFVRTQAAPGKPIPQA